MIDHFNLPVSDLNKSLEFYQRVLESLGYKSMFEDKDAYGFGIDHWEFGLYQCSDSINSLHLAFISLDQIGVDRFYKLAIENGAKSNGKPGLRQEYGSNYYAAYILDFDNHNIEAVCRI